MLLSFLAISALCVLITMISAFIVSHLNNDTSIVDIFWGVGFIIIALVTLFVQPHIILESYWEHVWLSSGDCGFQHKF